MKVGLNSAIYKNQGIDLKSVEKTIDKIFSTSTKNEPQVEKIDYSKLNKKSLGINLYSSRTSVDLQKQISTNQTNLYLKSINVAQLNSKAASSLYFGNTSKNNLAQINQDIELAAPKVLEKTKTIETFATADKNSSSSNKNNPFANTGKDKKQQERK